MIGFRDYLSLKRASFLFLIMPFLIEFILQFYYNEVFPYFKILILFIIIIIFDYIYLFIFNKLKNRIILFAITNSFLFIFFYYSNILLFFVTLNEHSLNLNLRAKYILPLVMVIIVYLIYKLRYRLNNSFYVLNIFLLIISFVKVYNNIKIVNIKSNSITSHPIKLTQNKGKPVILIVIDEYASPNELNKKYIDNNIFSFQKNLEIDNWIVNNHMFSEDTSTINSLASVFNFNIQSNDQSLSIPFYRAKLKSSSLFDSLEKKGIKFYNYGIFDIGKSKAMSKFYFYENENLNKKFMENFFSGTLILALMNNNESWQNKHNRLNIDFTFKKINKIDNKSFIYLHLLMPHAPYQFYGKNYTYKTINSGNKLDKYYDYWKFCNKILTPILSELTKENKYRLILTGDHGFRGVYRINSHYTFTAFYGFGKESIDSIKSVQDIGSLINSGY